MHPRVAVTVEQFWHAVPGGTVRATRGVLGGLQEVGGFELVGVSARHSRVDIERERSPIDVQSFSIPRPALYEAWHRLGVFPVERLVGPVDLIWAAAMVVPPNTAPTVVTVNDLDFLHHPERLSQRGRSFFPRAWQVTKERGTLLVAPTQMVADDLVSHGADVERVRVVPLGVDLVDVDPSARDDVRRRHGLPESFALFVGTIEPRKNLGRIVEAVARIADLPLVVVGPDGWVVEGHDLLGPLGDRAFRLGRVSELDLHALYAAAEVFLLPSLAEGFGLPVLEAMAQGTPVVTSSGTATEEVAGGAAVLVDPFDVSSIEAGIRSILESEDVASDLQVAGRERARTQTWRQSGSGYRDVFNEALELGEASG